MLAALVYKALDSKKAVYSLNLLAITDIVIHLPHNTVLTIEKKAKSDRIVMHLFFAFGRSLSMLEKVFKLR